MIKLSNTGTELKKVLLREKAFSCKTFNLMKYINKTTVLTKENGAVFLKIVSSSISGVIKDSVEGSQNSLFYHLPIAIKKG